MNALVSVVVPTYNRRADILRCLKAIVQSNYRNLEVIVVDNASIDDTVESVQSMYPTAKLIRNKRNLGVTGGRNIGAEAASGEYVFFVDHDVVVDENAINELINVMNLDPSIGIAGPCIYYNDEPTRIWAAGASISMLTGKASFNIKPLKICSDVQVLPGAFMTRKDVLNAVGLFDDIFFLAYEDTDFCFRIKETGYRVVCNPRAKAWHNTAFGKREQMLNLLSRSYYIARNKILFMEKHTSRCHFILWYALFMPLYAGYYAAHSLRYAKLSYAKKYWEGILDASKYVAFKDRAG